MSIGKVIRGFLIIKAAVFGAVILVLWARSYMVGDTFRKGNAYQYIELSSASGSVVARFGHDGNETKLEGSWEHVKAQEPAEMLALAGLNETPANKVGFGYRKQMIGSPPIGVVVSVMLPHWLVFLLAIPSLLRWLWRRSQSSGSRPVDGVMSWCPACWREIPGRVACCPECKGPWRWGMQVGLVPCRGSSNAQRFVAYFYNSKRASEDRRNPLYPRVPAKDVPVSIDLIIC